MSEQFESLQKNNTWLVNRPVKGRVVKGKRVYKKKKAISGDELKRYKARLIAKGFTQVEVVNYNEIFSAVVKHASMRVLLELEQLDVKTVFLHGDLEEKILMEQIEGFDVKKDKASY